MAATTTHHLAEFPGIEIEVIDTDCFLMRNALNINEQQTLFEYIQANDRTPWSTIKPAMVPSPKTLVLGENGEPSLNYEFGQQSAINKLIDKANEIIRKYEINGTNNDFQTYKSISMATIKYASPDGKFPPHIDHCQNSYVYLTSLGCTANFMVKGPNMTIKRDFKFNSGDMLIFDASTEAKILHGVTSIDSSITTESQEIGKLFPVLTNHRYGVQCRLYF